VGANNNLSPEEVTAIMNHERESWGNSAKKLSVEEIKKLMEVINAQPPGKK
jgi:cytochrome c oxidase cbb3-type subunit 2